MEVIVYGRLRCVQEEGIVTGVLTGLCLDRTFGTQIPPLRRADRERAQGCPFPYTSAQDRQGSHRCCTEAKATGTAASSRCRGGRHQRLDSWNYQPSGPECRVEWEVRSREEKEHEMPRHAIDLFGRAVARYVYPKNEIGPAWKPSSWPHMYEIPRAS